MGSSLEFLKGKKVVIVGGSSGIGLAVAAASLSYGATVVIASSSEEKVNSAVKQLGGGDGNLVSGFTVDAGDELKLFAFFDKVGVFDHLVWTATDKSAVGYPDIDLSEHRNVFDNTFWGPAAAGKYIHEKKLMASGGSITTTTGTVWQRPRKGWSIGGAAGAARVTLAKGMAIDLSPIR
ncbi:hypothetical protein BOTBODRAFT_300827 [Botryobasidium botryosum FD-172 SS1]|uniref:Uncharacterized protein n=1 Tax=Botryobasidium botryosum (strain FD-172 SS1) TaxID=930990 RepID=A0A067MT30_BOTB1|nr:hypothetical protein BOTBODRAFT_300827 [Botryobasidium botryosum FD-172 SS1]